MGGVRRHGIGASFQMKEDTVRGGRTAMAGIVDLRQVGLALIARVAEGHIIAVRVFHSVQAPPKDLGGIAGIRDPRVGGLAKIKLRAGLIRGQKVGLAVASRLLLHPREPTFDLGPVVGRACLHQLDVDAREAKNVVVARIIQAECGLPVDHPFVQFPAQAHPAVASGAVID